MPNRPPLPPALFQALAGLVGQPVLACLISSDGALAVIRARLTRVDTLDQVTYLHFSDEPQGTRLIVPGEFLLDVGPADENPRRLRLLFPGNAIELKDLSPRARLQHYQGAIQDALAAGQAGRGRLALLQAMIRSERDASASPELRAVLDQLLESRSISGSEPESVDPLDFGDEQREDYGELEDPDW